jgi:TonB-dependent starch-binding outer membrane protein SusC
MKKTLLLTVVCLLLLTATGFGQGRTITGKVTSSEDGSPAPGVNVLIKGTTIGTATDAEGMYSLDVPEGNNTLVFSFIGFKTVELEIGSTTVLNVAMETDAIQLSELVVVGYGTQIKQDLTGNVAKVKGDDLKGVPVTSFEQAIQGRAAGVFVEAGTGKLGQGMKIRIRGASSVSADNQPLYVIDGIPVTSQNQSTFTANTNPLADLNPNDIESIDILKDAAASAIYGSRAANGVVQITTRRGKSGKTKFNVSYVSGVTSPTNEREFLNTEEYVTLFSEARANTETLRTTRPELGLPNPGTVAGLEARFTRYGGGDAASWQDPAAPGYVDTDWQDQVFRNGKFNQLDISASGGNEKTQFFISGSMSDQEGHIVSNDLTRLGGRINLDHKVTDKFSVGVNFSLNRTINYRIADDNAFSTPLQIVALSPMTPVIDPRTGLVSGALDVNSGNPNTNFPIYYNPLLDLEYAQRTTTIFRNLGTFYAAYNFTKSLTFRTETGYDLLNQHEDAYYGRETSRNSSAPRGLGNDTWTQVFNYTTNNYLTFTRAFDQHNLEVVAGMSFQESHTDYSDLTAQQFPSNAFKEITSAAKITAGVTEETSFSFLSYFARANYKFKNRYLLGVSGRVDGSSRFGKDNRYGFFPAVSAGWILSEEGFLSGGSLISFLKLRASFGLTGNAEIGNFDSRGLYNGVGYAGVPGQSPLRLENPDLGWEQTKQTDIGIDFGLFNNRISGELDYYVKNTTDLLLNVNLPGHTGYRTQTRNIGELENKGFEVVLNTANLVGELKWNTSFNFSKNKNKITNLQDQIISGDFLSRAVEGEPIGIFYGPKYAGVDPENGDALYWTKDSDGTLVKTNDYNAAEFMKVGDPNPDFMIGLTNTFSYKGIDFSFLFTGVFGYQVYNGGGKYMTANGDFFDNQTRDQLARWQNPGDITDVPQARLLGANGTGESSRYVYDAGHVRLKTITLGYMLPQSFIAKAKLQSVRIYASAQNLLTFTDYDGWDPEVNSDTYSSTLTSQTTGNVNQGIDFYSAPQPKTITFGINIGF